MDWTIPLHTGTATDDTESEELRGLQALVPQLEHVFTEGVDTLRRHHQSETIRKRCNLLWDLVGSRKIFVALGPNVPTLTILGISNERGEALPVILLPRNWIQMIRANEVEQAGAIVNIGSQAIEIVRGNHDKDLVERGTMWEAEYLIGLRNFTLSNDYHREVLRKWPKGIRSPGADKFLDPSERPDADPAHGSKLS